MKIALCDDDINETESLKKLIESYSFEKACDITADAFHSPEELLSKEKYDLYFLDFLMPEMNGVDLALELGRKFNNAITVCYLTSYDNAAIDVINKGASAQAFLTKPAKPDEVKAVLDRFYRQSLGGRLVLRQDRRLKTVYSQDILYVEAVMRKSVFIFFDSKEEFGYTLSELENSLLPENLFFKIHRSYIVNMLHVESFNSKEVRMKNGDVLPLTRHREFKKQYTQFILDPV